MGRVFRILKEDSRTLSESFSVVSGLLPGAPYNRVLGFRV